MMLILFVSKSRKGTILGFTARCYAAERGIATASRPSVCPSVRLSVTLTYRDHISRNISKIISWLISPNFLHSVDPQHHGPAAKETPEIWAGIGGQITGGIVLLFS